MNIWAVIPARANSRGFPGKNLALLGGHPLVNFSITASRLLPFVSKTICTSDDPKFLSLSGFLGADHCVNRPAELADDVARDFTFFEHILSYCNQNCLALPDAFLLLRVVTPLRYYEDLMNAYKIFATEKSSSLRSVARAKSTPYKCWTRVSSTTNEIQPFFRTDTNIYEPYNAPRQILPEVLASTGSFEFVKTSTLINEASVSGATVLGYEVPSETFVDIDSYIDLELCAILLDKFDFIKPPRKSR